MNRFAVSLALLCWLPVGVAAQAIRCTDPASGAVLYTDQPCKGGALVVPKRSADELREDAANAALARERAERREEAALQRQQLRLEHERQAEAARPAPASTPADSETCRSARAEASFRAGSRTASEEEIRTARANAALACGQPPPAEIVVVPAPAPHWRPVHRPGAAHPVRPPPRPQPQPQYAPGTEPLPMLARPPSASR